MSTVLEYTTVEIDVTDTQSGRDIPRHDKLFSTTDCDLRKGLLEGPVSRLNSRVDKTL